MTDLLSRERRRLFAALSAAALATLASPFVQAQA